GFAGALRGEGRVLNIAVHASQPRICHREFGVYLSGALEKGQSGGITSRGENPRGRAIGFQGFERRRGGVGKRSVMLFDRGERFADAGSELTGNLTQGAQDVFLSRRLRLLLIEHVSGAAVLCAQAQYVLAFKGRYRAFQNSRTAGSLADFLSQP